MEYFNPLDGEGRQQNAFEPLENQRSGYSGLLYHIIFGGFLIAWSVKLYQSWPTAADQQANTVRNRLVNLLDEAEQEQDPAKLEVLRNEYDSLFAILDSLQPQEVQQ